MDLVLMTFVYGLFNRHPVQSRVLCPSRICLTTVKSLWLPIIFIKCLLCGVIRPCIIDFVRCMGYYYRCVQVQAEIKAEDTMRNLKDKIWEGRQHKNQKHFICNQGLLQLFSNKYSVATKVTSTIFFTNKQIGTSWLKL